MLAVAILAAGESRRMGRPKALLTYQGKTFVQHLLDATRHPRVGVVRVVLGARAAELQEKLRLDPSIAAINEHWPLGQLSSIQTGIRSLPEGTEGLILCPVDNPMISEALVAGLIEKFDVSGKAVVIPTFQGKRGHPVIFRAMLYAELLAASPEVGARQVVWAHAEETLEVPTEEEGVVLNINNPETYKRVTGEELPSS